MGRMTASGPMIASEEAAIGVSAREACPAIGETWRFVRSQWPRVVLVSLAVLVPCFWHKRIEAGDLSSHIYNAWLVELIEQGKVTGLHLAAQSNNILFDVIVERAAKLFGFVAAEKIGVSLAVLLFFWGSFAFVAAAVRRAAWIVAPVIAMLTYGWTFHMGFFNFYLSLAIAFLGIAIVWRGKKFDFVSLAVLVPLMWLAHPLGVAFFIAVGTYLALARVLPTRYQAVLLVIGIVGSIALAKYLEANFKVWPLPLPFYVTNGTDQLALFNDSYRLLAGILAFAAGALLVVEFAFHRERWSALAKEISVPAQLYVVIYVALLVLPNTIIVPKYEAPVALLVMRMSLALAVAGCAMLGVITPRLLHWAALGAIAALFFAALYLDTGRMNDMEAQVERMFANLPAGTRVISTGIPLPPSGWPMWHLVDRACIGHCFIYSNYEPASKQFRVRALAGNAVVVSTPAEVQEMQNGRYVARAEDLPAFGVTFCPDNANRVCGRFLQPGERLGLAAAK